MASELLAIRNGKKRRLERKHRRPLHLWDGGPRTLCGHWVETWTHDGEDWATAEGKRCKSCIYLNGVGTSFERLEGQRR